MFHAFHGRNVPEYAQVMNGNDPAGCMGHDHDFVREHDAF